eukprot:373626-Pelagomonas_calceolata.AAC.5
MREPSLDKSLEANALGLELQGILRDTCMKEGRMMGIVCQRWQTKTKKGEPGSEHQRVRATL